jgi:hypothetical protein
MWAGRVVSGGRTKKIVPAEVEQELQERDTFLALAVFVVISATLKFLFEGVTMTAAGRVFDLGHADALTYGALLTPVLGAHSYMKGKKITAGKRDLQKAADNPDGN